MRFVWPAQRYDRLTREATIVAAVLTTCAGFAIVLPAVRIYRAAETTGTPSTDERVETVTFLQPRAAPTSPSRSRSFVRPTSVPAAPLPPSSRTDTGSLITNHVESSARVEQQATAMPSEPTAAPRALGPYSASAAFTLGAGSTRALPRPRPGGGSRQRRPSETVAAARKRSVPPPHATTIARCRSLSGVYRCECPSAVRCDRVSSGPGTA